MHSTTAKAPPIADAPSVKCLKERQPLASNHLATAKQKNTALKNTTGSASKPRCQEPLVSAEVADESGVSKIKANGMSMTIAATVLATRLMID